MNVYPLKMKDKVKKLKWELQYQQQKFERNSGRKRRISPKVLNIKPIY